ncbi:calcium-binding and coiled-coil domain 2 [Holotrichia oblita]|uniref:Calcium-binding and coiled-coil domain 2 n=1 Tax=Holotrichia oblita TaxID=644536 RepID=A0ACB9SRA1_HOLOL|nr:calcium-binding and coiled-coil domain 2 [Holotrichia oblita]
MERIEDKFPSIKQLVEFTNIKVEYPDNECLKCTFKLLNYKCQEGDRIAIYKLGWNAVKEYIVFEWVPINDSDIDENYVVFNQSVLPKNTTDMFQLCYISSENQTYGVSEPFQLTNPNMKLSSLDCIRSFNSDSDYMSLNCERELLKLREENKFFRDKLQIFMSMLMNTQTLVCQQQKEINRLKERCDRLENKTMSMSLKDNLCNNFNNNTLKTLGTMITTTDFFDIEELETLPPFPFTK